MTKEQKALVVKLRDQGMTFAAIAEKLDISVNSIKSFYRRNGNASNTLNMSNDENQLYCKECFLSLRHLHRKRAAVFQIMSNGVYEKGCKTE